MKLFGIGCFTPKFNGGVYPTLRSCTWKPYPTSKHGPQQRNHHAVSVSKGHLYMYGGRGIHGTKNDFWKYEFSTGSWSAIKPSGEKPPALEGHSMVEYDSDLYVFGGENSFASAEEVPLWKFTIKLCTWRKLEGTATAGPFGRREHIAVRYQNFMCVHGGYMDLKGPTNELWMYSFNDNTWHLVEAASVNHSPVARYKHAGVVHDDFLWICGGLMGITDRNETQVWTWDFISCCWSQVRTRGVPLQLFNHSVCIVDDEVFIFGGNQESGEAGSKLWKAVIDEVDSTGAQSWKQCNFKKKLVPSPTCNSCLVLIPECLQPGSEKQQFKPSKLLRSDVWQLPDEKHVKAPVVDADSQNSLSSKLPIIEVKPYFHQTGTFVHRTAQQLENFHAISTDISSSYSVEKNSNFSQLTGDDHFHDIDHKQSLLPSGEPCTDTANNMTLSFGKGDPDDSKDLFDDIGCEASVENLPIFDDQNHLIAAEKSKLSDRLDHLSKSNSTFCDGFHNPAYNSSSGLHEAETVKRFSYNLSASQELWRPLQKNTGKFATTSFIETGPSVEEKVNEPLSKGEVKFINNRASEQVIFPDIFMENAKLLDRLENTIVHQSNVKSDGTLLQKREVSLLVLGGKEDRSSRAMGKQGISMWKCHITYD